MQHFSFAVNYFCLFASDSSFIVLTWANAEATPFFDLWLVSFVRGDRLRSWFTGIRCSDAMKEFLNDLGKCLGHVVKPSEAFASSGDPAEDAPEESKSSGSGLQTDLPETAEQQLDPIRQAKKHGYQQDAVIMPNKTDEMWKITKVVDQTFHVRRLVQGKFSGDEKEVSVIEVVEKWKVNKKKLAGPLPSWDAYQNPCCPSQSAQWAVDCIKGAIALALRQDSTLCVSKAQASTSN